MDDQDEKLTVTPAEVSETIRESMERAKELISNAKQTLNGVDARATEQIASAQ